MATHRITIEIEADDATANRFNDLLGQKIDDLYVEVSDDDTQMLNAIEGVDQRFQKI